MTGLATSSVTRPPPRPRTERARVAALDEDGLIGHEERAEEPGDEVRPEVLDVGVEERHELAARLLEGTGHRLALAVLALAARRPGRRGRLPASPPRRCRRSSRRRRPRSRRRGPPSRRGSSGPRRRSCRQSSPRHAQAGTPRWSAPPWQPPACGAGSRGGRRWRRRAPRTARGTCPPGHLRRHPRARQSAAGAVTDALTWPPFAGKLEGIIQSG